jgi:decaprenylphospho-beta-D-erythro-pentofuranosid-2-ulose 2-reductase
MKTQQPSILILGAGSDIGIALANAAAKIGCPLLLAARELSTLEANAERLRSKYHTEVEVLYFDALKTDSHKEFLDQLGNLPTIVICLVGLLGDQATAERSFVEADLILRTNLAGPISIMGEVANRMEARNEGAIVGVSSVSGDRGRAENYVYGAAKAGFTTFLSGLRQRLARTSVRVVTVKPGPVRTKMTSDRRAFLMTTPDAIAASLLRACLKARGVVYLPWYWRPIMTIIRCLPETLFKSLTQND